MAHETPIDDTYAEKVSQLLELESVEEKDQIVVDVLKNGRQMLVKYENNDHYELVLQRTAEYGTTYTKSSSILAIILQLLFQGIDDDCLKNKAVFFNLWSSVTSEGLEACHDFADYIAEDDLKQQLDDPVSPLFQALRIYYDEKLPELFKKHNISDTKDLYNVVIENAAKSGWLVGIEAVKGKIPPVKYKQLLADITPPSSQTPKEVTPQTQTPTDSNTAAPDGIHPDKV